MTTNPPDLVQKVSQALLELRLKEAPPQDDNRLAFLWRILEPQLIGLQERRIERRIREARFPSEKSFDHSDWAFNPKLDGELIEQLTTLDFIRQGFNVLCAGMSGTGKSHVCIALGYLACAAGHRVRYTTSAAMLDDLYAHIVTQTLSLALKPYVRCEVLIIDEVGIERPDRDTDRDASLFYKVVQSRYEAVRSTIVTTNIQWDSWGEYLGDELATSAILDRLVHRGYALRFEGRSYRAAQHELLNQR